jgi:hypothetical protein
VFWQQLHEENMLTPLETVGSHSTILMANCVKLEACGRKEGKKGWPVISLASHT